MTRERDRRIVLTSSVGVAQRVAQVAATFITFPLLIHSLGVGGFGVWAAASSLAWIAWMLDVGLGNALVTLVPEALAGRGDKTAGEIVGGALTTAAGLSCAFLAAGGVALTLYGHSIEPAFLVAGIGLAINIPLGLGARMWLAVQKGYVSSVWELGQTLLTLALLVAGALAHSTVGELTLCVYGAMLGTNGGALIHVLATHGELRPRNWPRPAAFKRLATTGFPMLGISMAGAVTYALDNTLALVWLGATAAAQMAIAVRLFTTSTGFITVIAQSLWPAFAEAAAKRDLTWMRQTLRRGLLVTATLACTGSLALAGVGGPLLRWWLGRDLGVNGAMLWLIGAWVTAAALDQAPLAFLLAVRRLTGPLAVLSIAAVVGLGLKYVAAQHGGVNAMLAVNAVLTASLIWPSYLALCRRWFGSALGRL
jgi:O-antigen/teichoic acid export membrane protein